MLKETGADLVGFSDCKDYFSEYTTAITLGVSSLQILALQRTDFVQALNETLDYLNIRVRQILSEEHYGCWGPLFSQEESPQSRTVPHRELAIKAGLGFIGRNFLLITPQYGPRVHLTTVLTTMPLLPDSPLDFNPCKTCDTCVRECPTHALREYFRGEMCIKCSTCVAVCPVGEDFEKIKRYEPSLWSRARQ